MPIYVYHPAEGECCEHCEGGFDHLQKLDAPDLTVCPECGCKVKRTVTAPKIAGSNPSLKEDNLARHGFTQYRKLEKGVYEKTTGSGPDIISDKDSS